MTILPTSLVGSYPQPEWLIDREKLAGRFPPRVRMAELWRVAEPYREEAFRDATLIAIRAQENAGLDIITDGEMRRESYSNRFATALDGVDMENFGTALDRSGEPVPVPKVVGPISRRHAVQVEDVRFLRANTDRLIKMTVPGPFTMSQQAQNAYYPALVNRQRPPPTLIEVVERQARGTCKQTIFQAEFVGALPPSELFLPTLRRRSVISTNQSRPSPAHPGVGRKKSAPAYADALP